MKLLLWWGIACIVALLLFLPFCKAAKIGDEGNRLIDK